MDDTKTVEGSCLKFNLESTCLVFVFLVPCLVLSCSVSDGLDRSLAPMQGSKGLSRYPTLHQRSLAIIRRDTGCERMSICYSKSNTAHSWEQLFSSKICSNALDFHRRIPTLLEIISHKVNTRNNLSINNFSFERLFRENILQQLQSRACLHRPKPAQHTRPGMCTQIFLFYFFLLQLKKE